MGAEAAVDYTRAAWVKEVLDLTGGEGVAACIDNVGGSIFTDSIEAMSRGGRMVNCGTTAGPLDVSVESLRSRRVSFTASYMGSNGYLHEILELFEAGALKPVIYEVFPFERIQDAHRAMIDRNSFGKIILVW